ncbi:MAG: KTSC domain-containing protein [Candidatus Marinimicrobia bacterium]|nr:KTSC domain-containing protein [Candidatus Neomarinimicrobiota bacterium]
MSLLLVLVLGLLLSGCGECAVKTTPPPTEAAFVPVESSVLDGAKYDAAEQRMTLRFKSGSEYVYDQVPAAVYQSLIAAESPGAYYNAHIKGQFTGPDPKPAAEADE